MQHLLYHFQIKSPLAFERPLGLLLWNNFGKMLGKNSLTCQTYIPGYLKCSRCHFFSSFTEQKSLEEDKLSCDGVSQLPWWTVVLLHLSTGSHYVPFNLATSSGEIQICGPVQSEVFLNQPNLVIRPCFADTKQQSSLFPLAVRRLSSFSSSAIRVVLILESNPESIEIQPNTQETANLFHS